MNTATPLLRKASATSSERVTQAIRSDFERRFGWWSQQQQLAEDGRATVLFSLPDGGALLLARTGDILAVHADDKGDLFRVRIFSGRASRPWDAVGALYPGAVPGTGAMPRYWTLREAVTPHLSTHAVFDLLQLSVVVRDIDPQAIQEAVRQANEGVAAELLASP